MRSIFLWLCLAGCAPDADGDGWSEAEDCDDADAEVHPNALEVCDLRDQDCDGDVDELAVDAVTWHRDQDGDSYGHPTRQIVACSAPGSDWARTGGDCDDNDAAKNPDADEVCDQQDQDCDGNADEGFVCGESSCDDGLDEDGDGLIDCADPDCDGACPETCSDKRDNDKNGATDCADRPCWSDPACVEPDCGDGTDNEQDGLVDCDDPDCWSGECPNILVRVTRGSLALNAETVTWTEAGCEGEACPRGVDRAWEVQEYDVEGEIVRLRRSGWIRCAFGWSRGRTFERRADDVLLDVVSDRPDFWIEPGCGPVDDRFVPRRLVWDRERLLTMRGQPWMAGDLFEAETRLSDFRDDEREGQISRFFAFVDPIRPLQPWGTCTEGEPGAAFADEDRDGWGALGVGIASCTPTEPPADCDDADIGIPTTETCGDGVDADCDATATCAGPAGIQAARAGPSVPASSGLPRLFRVGDLDGDGLADLAVATPLDDRPAEDAGLVRALRGTDLTEIGTWTGPTAGELLGAAVSPLGDVTGDGKPDLAAAAPGVVYAGIPRSGAVYLLPSESSGVAGEVLVQGVGEWVGAWISSSDLNNDGHIDLLVGAQTDATAASQAGSVRGFRGPLRAGLALADADWTFLGDARNEIVGDAFAAVGDTDGDGLTDIAIGKRKGEAEAGSAHLFLGGGLGTRALADADSVWAGELEGAWAGERVVGAGDIDQDGYQDWLVAAPRTWGKAPREVALYGEVYLISGEREPEGGWLRDATAVFRADRVVDALGADVAGGDDVDGDGVPDLLIGAPGDDRGGAQAGALLVFRGPLSGVWDASDADGIWRGQAGWQVGGRVALPGDLDGDGFGEVVGSGFLNETESFWTVIPGGVGW
jgi:hypothetical protein